MKTINNDSWLCAESGDKSTHKHQCMQLYYDEEFFSNPHEAEESLRNFYNDKYRKCIYYNSFLDCIKEWEDYIERCKSSYKVMDC